MVLIEAGRSANAGYNFISAYAANALMWSLNSNGFIDSQSGATFRTPIYGTAATFSAGETISAGGLVVYDGETVASGNLVITNGAISATQTTSSTTAVATFLANSASFTSNVLALGSVGPSASTFRYARQFRRRYGCAVTCAIGRFIDAVAAGTRVFDVLGTGRTTIYGGGLFVSGGVTASDTGCTVVDGGLAAAQTTDANVVTITASAGTYSSTLLLASVSAPSSASFYLQRLTAGGSNIFTV